MCHAHQIAMAKTVPKLHLCILPLLVYSGQHDQVRTMGKETRTKRTRTKDQDQD